jgi:hypothetical protein
MRLAVAREEEVVHLRAAIAALVADARSTPHVAARSQPRWKHLSLPGALRQRQRSPDRPRQRDRRRRHSILFAAWHVLTTGEPDRDAHANELAQPDPARATRRLVTQLERLSHTVTQQQAAAYDSSEPPLRASERLAGAVRWCGAGGLPLEPARRAGVRSPRGRLPRGEPGARRPHRRARRIARAHRPYARTPQPTIA